jgi:exopolysaccharide/PEP-CTERM locus tyrosine autokinase
MSLIERAVARLSKAGSQGTAPRDDQAQRPNTIDVLADRLAAQPAAEPDAPPHVQANGQPHPAAAGADPARPHLARPPAPPVSPPPAAPTVQVEPLRIQLEGLRAAGLVTPSGDQTPTFAQFRVIKRPLINNAFGRQDRAPLPNAKRVMVTSAFPGEGKTFCAINLAMSIAAERDHQVILIDADVARPALPRILGIDPGPGLLDWLAAESPPDIGEFVLPTNVDSLSVLRSGRKHEHATELLASAAMGRLLDTLTARYPHAILIFDTPPLLVTTEARVVASFMGQIVMVVEAGKTPRESVAEALSTIESCEVVGLVLNKAHKVEKQGYYHGYGYGQLPAT